MLRCNSFLLVYEPGMKLFVPLDIIFCCNRNWFATVAWTVGIPGMKLFVPVDINFYCNRNWFATVAWTVRIFGMKLFVPVDIIFCFNRNWFATVAWTVRMPGMKWTASCWHRKLRDWSTSGQLFPAAQVGARFRIFHIPDKI
jgi:hypothetical protein